jgi:type VI secretion system ImpA family protein
MTDQREEGFLQAEAGTEKTAARAAGGRGPGSDFRLDLDPLLKPIDPDRPSGDFLRYEGTYDALREARHEEDATLPTGVWERNLKRADWQNVYRIAAKALETRTKDLQIAVWMTEALLHLHGFAGFREGLALMIHLCERFWPDIHPQLAGDDLEDRVSPFVWMNEKLAIRLKFVPVTMPQAQDSQAYSFADWEAVNELDAQAMKNPRLLEEAEAAGRPTRAIYLGSVMFSSRGFYARQAEQLRDIRTHLEGLNAFLDQKGGRDAPSLDRLMSISEEVRRLVVRFLNEKKVDTTPGADNADGDVDDLGEDSEAGGRPAYLTIRNRSEAYRMLSEAADYLLIHEPHSPTPYLVKRAVLWGQLTLTELLQELVNNQDDLRQILTLLGIRKSDR